MLERRKVGPRMTFTQAFFGLNSNVRRNVAMKLGLSDAGVELTLSELEAGKNWILNAQKLGKLQKLQQATWEAWRARSKI